MRRRWYVTKAEAETKARVHAAEGGEAEVSRIPDFIAMAIFYFATFVVWASLAVVVVTIWDAIR